MNRRPPASAVVALADQAAAAQAHATATVRALAARTPRTALLAARWPFLDWIAATAFRSVRSGTAHFCPHVDRARPSVLHVFAHEPATLRCVPCAEQHGRSIHGTLEDRTCDACGHVDPDGVFAGATAAGPLLLSFGLCQSCRDGQMRGPKAGAA